MTILIKKEINMTVISNPKDLKALKDSIIEMTNSLQTIESEKEHMKDIADATEEKFGIKKKYLNKVARVMFKASYADLQSENEHFEDLYETIAEGKKVSDMDAD